MKPKKSVNCKLCEHNKDCQYALNPGEIVVCPYFSKKKEQE